MGLHKYQRQKCLGFVAVFCSLIAATTSVPDCYVDTGDPNALAHKKHTSVTNTLKMCRYVCGLDGYVYAGVENGKDCFCGDQIHGTKVKDDQDCKTMKCPGDPNEICGGNGRIWIVLSTHEVPSCFQVKVSTEKFSVKAYEDTKSNTHEKCQMRCGHLGYIYAAVQNGVNCHCFNAFTESEVRPAAVTQCNKVCSGNKKQNCGGLNHKWIMPSSSSPDQNCITYQSSTGYKGKLSVSESNRKCLSWTQVLEKNKKLVDEFISRRIASLTEEEKTSGYCRNFDKSLNGPWCFIDLKGTREDCYVPICKSVEPGVNCLIQSSSAYTGTQDISKRGKECMVWNKVKKDDYKDVINSWNEKDKSSNYCRSLKGQKPGCYIEVNGDVFVDECDIAECSEALSSNTCMSSYDDTCLAHQHITCLKYEDGFEYIGSMSKSATGRHCLPWSHEAVQVDLHKSKAMWQEYHKWPKSVQKSNLCRNPDRIELGPWCYVSPGYRELCHIEICAGAPVVRKTAPAVGEVAKKTDVTNKETEVGRK